MDSSIYRLRTRSCKRCGELFKGTRFSFICSDCNLQKKKKDKIRKEKMKKELKREISKYEEKILSLKYILARL
jgi:hypothetical protein